MQTGSGGAAAEGDEALDAAEARRLRALCAAVEAGLVEAVPGLAIQDRDLELGGGRCVDLLGLDAARRLVLVLLVGGDDEGREVLPAVADAVVFARKNGALFARHWDLASPPRAELEPLVVLVSDRFSPDLRERLALLSGLELALFEVREVTTAAASRVFLVPAGGERAEPGAEPPGLAGFLAGLPEAAVALVRELVPRIERIDERLRRGVSRTGVHWTDEGRPVAALLWSDGRLEGEVAGEAHPIRTAADADRLVERALAAHLARLRTGSAAAEPGAVNGHAELPPPRGPDLLTPEEIEAFRE